jgi:lipoprotein-releasing system ATP-binding protein
VIVCNKINKTFGQLRVLKNVDFSAEAGEIVSIVGASGAGKSTLLQVMGTLLPPDGGSVFIDGTDVSSLGSSALSGFRNEKIGFVFQFHHLLPEFTAEENVMIPALIRYSGKGSVFFNNISRKELGRIRERADIMLDEIGLSGRQDHKPSELSGGEQQRVAIARALMNDPAVLFADEPTGNLDSKTKEDIHGLFLNLRDKFGATIVIVTHDLSLAERSDRILTLKDGEFV